MSDLHGLWLYFVMVLGVILLPGMNMAFVAASSVVAGTRGGIAATAGIVLGGIIHIAIVGTGIVNLLQTHPVLLPMMLIAGSMYTAWIGWQVFRIRFVDFPEIVMSRSTLRLIFTRAAVTSLLNPKAYLFLLAIFPQFVGDGQVSATRLAALTLITSLTGGLVYGTVAVMAGAARSGLQMQSKKGAWLTRAIGCMLMVAACMMAAKGLQGGLPPT